MADPEEEHFPYVPEEEMKGYEEELERKKEEEEKERREEEREEERREREEERREKEEKRREREREKEEKREKKEEYEEIATAGLSIGAIIGIGILGIIALSLTGSGQYQYPQGESSVNEWKPLTEDEIQNVMIINDKY